jgi:hypothetical protein
MQATSASSASHGARPQPAVSIGPTAFGFVGIILFPYLCILNELPKYVMRRILRGFADLAGGYNKIHRFDNANHFNRNIPGPCPDFRYTVVPVDFQKLDTNQVLVFQAPAAKYSCLGIYDETTLCKQLTNHSEEQLCVVIAGPDVSGSDDVILESIGSKYKITHGVIHFPSASGLVLHRLIAPFASGSDDSKQRQLEIKCSPVTLEVNAVSGLPAGNSGWLLFGILFYLIVSASFGAHLVVGAKAQEPNPTDLNLDSLLSGILALVPAYLAMLLVSVLAAVGTVAAMKNRLMSSLMGIVDKNIIGQWLFLGLKSRTAKAGADQGLGFQGILDIFGILFYFLNGPLGLLATEVVYGFCKEDNDHAALEYGKGHAL